MSFSDLGLNPALQQALSERGYKEPSPIQAEAIPAVLQGHDILAAAQTGTGKTAGFTLPILHRLSAAESGKKPALRALILAPTRELAAQIGDSVRGYGRHLRLKSTVVYGGVKIGPQMSALRRGADILVATPGRLLDLYNQGAVDFKQLEILVLDEADRMLDMGFIHDIRKIISKLPAQRQTLLFSATFSKEVRSLAQGLVKKPVEISVTPANTTVERVEQSLYSVDKDQKTSLLIHLLQQQQWQQVLVFTRTKHGANRLAATLDKNGIRADAIHGNKSQGARTRTLKAFKDNKLQVLVATDIAARGIDIQQLPQVVNFDLPNVAEDYVHRIGRTGRAGAAGQAVSLVSAEEYRELVCIEQLIGQLIKRYSDPQFTVHKALPESRLGQKIPPKNGKARPAKNRNGKPSSAARGHQRNGENRSHADKPAGKRPQRRRKSNAEGRRHRAA